MRSIQILLIGIILFGIFMGGCSEDEAKDTLLPDKMNAIINDTSWKTDVRYTYKYDNLNQFLINGTSVSGKTLNITLFGTQEDTYDLNTNVLDTTAKSNVDFSAFYKPTANTDTSDFYYAKKGEVTLEKVNTSEQTITGSFHFTMFTVKNDTAFMTEDTVKVEQGTFKNIEYKKKEK